MRSRDWSEVDEDLLLSGDPPFDESLRPAGSTPKKVANVSRAGSTPKTGSDKSGGSLNDTVVEPPQEVMAQVLNRKRLMEQEGSRSIKMEIDDEGRTCEEIQIDEMVSAVGQAMERCSTRTETSACTTESDTRQPKEKLSEEDKAEVIQPQGEFKTQITLQLGVIMKLLLLLVKRNRMAEKLIISTDDYPTSIIDMKAKDEIMEYVRVAMNAQIAIDGNDQNIDPIGFGANRIRGGQVVVLCNNYRTAVWLNKTVKGASRDKAFAGIRSDLVCKPIAEINALPSFTIWHEREYITFEEVKTEIRRELAINTDSWKILNEKKIPINSNGGGGGIRFTAIANRELTTLMNPDRTRQFSYGLMGRPVFIRWLKGEDEMEGGKFKQYSIVSRITELYLFKIATCKKRKPDVSGRHGSRRSPIVNNVFRRSWSWPSDSVTMNGRTRSGLSARLKSLELVIVAFLRINQFELCEEGSVPVENRILRTCEIVARKNHLTRPNHDKVEMRNGRFNYLNRNLVVKLLCYMFNMNFKRRKALKLNKFCLKRNCVCFTSPNVPRKGITFIKEDGRSRRNGN